MNVLKYCQKLSEKNLKHFGHGKAALVFFYVPKVLKMADLSKTVHFGKYYFNKLQLNGMSSIGYLGRFFETACTAW
jgi:hypothetical protein